MNHQSALWQHSRGVCSSQAFRMPSPSYEQEEDYEEVGEGIRNYDYGEEQYNSDEEDKHDEPISISFRNNILDQCNT
jgi:hypothetical protein